MQTYSVSEKGDSKFIDIVFVQEVCLYFINFQTEFK